MEFEKPIYDRIDLCTKVWGVILVALGIDRLRSAQINKGLLLILWGAAISLIPFFIGVKNGKRRRLK